MIPGFLLISLHGCETKCGSGLGTRLHEIHVLCDATGNSYTPNPTFFTALKRRRSWKNFCETLVVPCVVNIEAPTHNLVRYN